MVWIPCSNNSLEISEIKKENESTIYNITVFPAF